MSSEHLIFSCKVRHQDPSKHDWAGVTGSDVEIEIINQHGWYKMLQNMLRNCELLLNYYTFQRFNPRFLCNTAWALTVGASTSVFNFLQRF